MKKIMASAAVLALLVLILAVANRHALFFRLMTNGEPPPLLDRVEESPDAQWFDEYFLVEALDERTHAIGEPLYAQQNYSYLIEGTQRALLFDAGPGYRDIRAVAESLTDLPITFLPSHLHFDHIGNRIIFDDVALVDLPHLRRRAKDNRLQLTWAEHLGSSEGVAAPTLEVDEWIAVGSDIDLGERRLRVVYTPGHTDDSISLVDQSSDFVFTGDFLYPGPLYAFLPNSSLGEYLQGSEDLLAELHSSSALYGAHRDKAPGVPRLSTSDLMDLRDALLTLRAGDAKATGTYPRTYRVNERLRLLAEPRWLQDW